MSKSDLTCAVVQLQSSDDVSANLVAVRQGVAEAARRGARVVLLPENFAYFGTENGRAELAEDVSKTTGPIMSALATLCREYGLYVVGGGMPEKSNAKDRPYNACVVIDPQGQLQATYRKMHLFDVTLPSGQTYNESRSTSAGDDVIVVEVDGFRLGLSVCYDLRFPLLFDKLRQKGAEVLVVPAAFTQLTGQDHWAPLLQARAIENQCWLLAAGQWGKHPGDRATYGHSMIIDPWGTIVAQCPNQPSVAVASVDKARLEDVRARIPCFSHRRLG
jgi:deaminated glutathione amidase